MPMPIAPMIIPTKEGTNNRSYHSEDRPENAGDNAYCPADQSEHEAKETTEQTYPDRKGENDNDGENY